MYDDKGKLQQIYEFLDKVKFESCIQCGKCCSNLWLLEEEYEQLLHKIGGEKIIKNKCL